MTTDLYTRNQGYKTISILLQDVFTAINKFRDFIYETDSWSLILFKLFIKKIIFFLLRKKDFKFYMN